MSSVDTDERPTSITGLVSAAAIGSMVSLLAGRASDEQFETVSLGIPFTVLPFTLSFVHGSRGGGFRSALLIGATPGVTCLAVLLYQSGREIESQGDLTFAGGVALFAAFGVVGLGAGIVGQLLGMVVSRVA